MKGELFPGHRTPVRTPLRSRCPGHGRAANLEILADRELVGRIVSGTQQMSISDRRIVLGLERGTVRLVPADPRWPEVFAAEADRLAAAVRGAGLKLPAFEHVGSTAVPGLLAKPIIDFMAGYTSSAHAQR